MRHQRRQTVCDLRLHQIHRPARMRPPTAAALGKAMVALHYGNRNWIAVRGDGDGYLLMRGAALLEAAWQMGRDFVRASVYSERVTR
jgi:hypothetical protein